MHVPGHLHSQIISCSLIDLKKPVFLDMLTETASSHLSLFASPESEGGLDGGAETSLVRQQGHEGLLTRMRRPASLHANRALRILAQ